MNTTLQGPVGAVTLINGRPYDYYGGCGYLGLQSEPEILQAAAEALLRFGFSTATSRGGYGESPLYSDLEEQACAYFACEKILYFATGYLGPAALIQSDLHARDHFFIDEDAHFSLWDAASAANRVITPFAHLSPAALSTCLAGELQAGERPIVLTDGLFPISGEIAPLPEYLELVERNHGRLIVDDAHGAGVLGMNGRGTLDYFGLDQTNCRVSATFNKALGGFGGFIQGTTSALSHIEENARTLIGSSPPPLPAAAASAQALKFLRQHPQRLQNLCKNVQQARQGLGDLGWQLEESPSPILCLPGRKDVNLFTLRDALFARGIAVEFVNSYPSSPAGGALRLAICATHTPDQIDHLLMEMRGIL